MNTDKLSALFHTVCSINGDSFKESLIESNANLEVCFYFKDNILNSEA